MIAMQTPVQVSVGLQAIRVVEEQLVALSRERDEALERVNDLLEDIGDAVVRGHWADGEIQRLRDENASDKAEIKRLKAELADQRRKSTQARKETQGYRNAIAKLLSRSRRRADLADASAEVIEDGLAEMLRADGEFQEFLEEMGYVVHMGPRCSDLADPVCVREKFGLTGADARP